MFSVHAAIIAINEAIDKEEAEETMKALRNPSAMLLNLADDLPENYQVTMYEAKKTKADIARNKVHALAGCNCCKMLSFISFS